MAERGDIDVAVAIARLSTQLQHMEKLSTEARVDIGRQLDGLGQRLSNHADTLHAKIDDSVTKMNTKIDATAKDMNARIETVGEQVTELDHCVDRRVGAIEGKLGTWRAIAKFVTATVSVAAPVLGAIYWIVTHVRIQP